MKQLIKTLFPAGKRDALASCLKLTAADRWMPSVSRWAGLAVYNYHRIGVPEDCQGNPALISATQESFETQVKLLKQTSDVIGIDDLDSVLRASKGRYSLITFDDGYLDNYTLAFPVLKSAGVRATFFLTTGFLDRQAIAWWDDVYQMVHQSTNRNWDQLTKIISGSMPENANQLSRAQVTDILTRYYWSLPHSQTESYLNQVSKFTNVPRLTPETSEWMTWDMVREMRDNGMDFGAHTVNHPILTRIGIDQLIDEISQSKRRIETELNISVQTLSYPVGLKDCFNQTVIDVLKECGILYAFSFYGGTQKLGQHNAHDLQRMAVSLDLNNTLFKAIVSLPEMFLRPKPASLQITTGQLPDTISQPELDPEIPAETQNVIASNPPRSNQSVTTSANSNPTDEHAELHSTL